MKKIWNSAANIILFTALLLIANGSTVKAQKAAMPAGTNQIGVRLGGFSGLNFRHVGSRNVGFELNLMASGFYDWGLISGEIDKHFPIGGHGFVIYVGGGAYIANNGYYYHYRRNDFIYSRTVVGLEGVVGLDYYIPNVPLNVGIDIRPRFNYVIFAYPWDGGISISYVF